MTPSDSAAALTGALPSVTMVGPTGNTTANPAVTWNAIPNADAYRVWMNDRGGRREVTLFTAADAGCAGAMDGCSVVLASTLRAGACQVWVRAENEDGVGVWGSGLQFTVTTADPVPQTPTGVVTDSTPLFTWASSGAASYQLWVSNAGGTRINQVVSSAAAGCSAGQVTCFFDPNVVLALGNTSWWIRAAAGRWSARMDFRVSAVAGPPVRPTLLAPIDDVVVASSTVTYQWTAVADAISYQLWVNDVTGTAINETILAQNAGCDAVSCSYISVVNPADGRSTWWIRARTTGGFGNWSLAESFTFTFTATDPPPGPFTNGGFESGYDNWQFLESTGTPMSGTFGLVSDGQTVLPNDVLFDYNDQIDVTQTSPGLPILFAATEGSTVGVMLVNGAEEHRMFQDVTLPACSTALVLTWDMAYNNHAGTWSPTQFIAINVRNIGTDDVLATPFTVSGPVQSAMAGFSADLTAYAGQEVRLEFNMTIFDFYMDVSFDNFNVVCD